MTFYLDENKLEYGTIWRATKQEQIHRKENSRKVLEKAGESFDDVIKTINYITPQPLLEYPKPLRSAVGILRAAIQQQQE